MGTGWPRVMGIAGVETSASGLRTIGRGRAVTVLRVTRMCFWVPVRAARMSLARVWVVQIQVKHLMGMRRVGLRAVRLCKV